MSTDLIKQTEKLMTLFRGSSKAHGCYTEQINNDPLKKKVKGRAVTVSSAPTLKRWLAHVQGETGIGVIPINEDNRCWWGVLDIDGEVNHKEILGRIKALDLPLVMCYSKSRSAHCFLFLEESVEAASMRSVLEEMASKLGVSGCEIFPKQDSLNIEKGDLGNWLNMPYFNGERRCVILDGDELKELSLDEFLPYANSKRLSPDAWSKFVTTTKERIDDLNSVLDGAPPCIQYILKTQGIREGNRNKLMYNIAIYCKKRYPEDIFQDKVKEIHDEFAESPLSIKELSTIIKSVEGKDYRYQCKDAMLKQFCNASICVDREQGIDFSTEIKTLKDATRILTNPSIYAVEVELESERPNKVYVTVEQLFRQELFRRECAEQLHKTFTPISPKQWNEISTRIVNTAINQEPPLDMQEDIQMYIALSDFLINRAQDDIRALESDDGVYVDEETKLYHFRIAGFKTYLIHKGLVEKGVSGWKIGSILNNICVQTDEVDMKTGTTVKRKINIGQRNLRSGTKVYYTRTVAMEDLVFLDNTKKAVEGVF